MVETDLMRTLERRVATLERQLRDYHEAASTTPSIALQELKTLVDTFRNKLETIEHLSWLGKKPVFFFSNKRAQHSQSFRKLADVIFIF